MFCLFRQWWILTFWHIAQSVLFCSSLLSSPSSPCACLSELQSQTGKLPPSMATVSHALVSPGVGLEWGRGHFGATGLNGFIMQSSRHRGDVWSHNGTRANIIQIFSQSKFNTRPKSRRRKGGLKKGGLKKGEKIHTSLLPEINS